MRERSLIALFLLVSVLVSSAATDRAYAAEGLDTIQLAEAGGGSNSQPAAAADPAYADMACGTPSASPACPIDVEAQTRHLQALLDKCDGEQDCFYARIREENGATAADAPLCDQQKHFLTGDMQRIASKYGLDLDGDWNKERLPQQGRHASEHHEWVLDRMEKIDRIAGGDREIFLHRFETDVKAVVRANPEMLYSAYWQ